MKETDNRWTARRHKKNNKTNTVVEEDEYEKIKIQHLVWKDVQSTVNTMAAAYKLIRGSQWY